MLRQHVCSWEGIVEFVPSVPYHLELSFSELPGKSMFACAWSPFADRMRNAADFYMAVFAQRYKVILIVVCGIEIQMVYIVSELSAAEAACMTAFSH